MENKFTDLANEYGVKLKKMPNGYQFRDDKYIINYYDSTGTLVMRIKGESESIVNKKAGMFFLKECLNDCFGVKPKSLNDQYAEIEKVRKEYLDSAKNYIYVQDTAKRSEDWIEIPEGAEAYGRIGAINTFYKDGFSKFANENNSFEWEDSSQWVVRRKHEILILWSRFTQPDELPFVDDEPKRDYFKPSDFGAKVQDFSGTVKPQPDLSGIELNLTPKHSHYFKDVSDVAQIDVYDVLLRFGVTDPCLQHIVKKALCAGNRGHKDFERDLQDIYDTAKRALEIHGV